tara:strand:+ start:798 stop:1769 length:972 start_codon:yes stop_codon:yes gene_type:complete
MTFIRHTSPYEEILSLTNQSKIPDRISISDHLTGFSENGYNDIFNILNTLAEQQNSKITVTYHNIFDENIKTLYPNLVLEFSADAQDYLNLGHFKEYPGHPTVQYKNFLCSFNGSNHVSRQLLTACLSKMGMFNPNYSSKNFTNTTDEIDGLISGHTNDERFYRKFFISDNSEEFFQTVYSFGYERYKHNENAVKLENKITESFIHIISETMATSYVPFVTEKFLYSVVTRGLFLSYSQPGWHNHVEKYYGFKKYNKLFDYKFDSIQNPIERLIELVTMISKFQKLTYDELYDLYLIELDTIDYNYNHYYSGDYLKKLKESEQ